MRVALFLSLFACLAVSNLSAGVVWYDLTQLGPHEYHYDYILTGLTFSVNQELDVRFDPTVFESLSNATAGAGFYLVPCCQPNNPSGAFGDYEIIALSAIASPPGAFGVDVSVPGFEPPAAQPFFINQLDPDGKVLYNITAGFTVADPADQSSESPEPASGHVIGMGLLVGVTWWATRRRLRSAVRST
jgi:hypothetical protein